MTENTKANTTSAEHVFPSGYSDGMDLRDYFAAQAMQGAIAHGLFNAEKASNNYADFVACVAYQYADAMMDARQP
jgi:hypothetical protein